MYCACLERYTSIRARQWRAIFRAHASVVTNIGVQQGGHSEDVAAQFAVDGDPPLPEAALAAPPPAADEFDGPYCETLMAVMTNALIIFTAPTAAGEAPAVAAPFMPHMLAALAHPQRRFHAAVSHVLRALDLFLEARLSLASLSPTS